MTVETTVQEMFDEYPDLFSTRQECFNHLFCTVGNGYEWKYGQLVELGRRGRAEHDEDYLRPAAAEASQSEENIARKRKDDEDLWELRRENDLEDGLPDIGPYNPGKRRWYPLSLRHSMLFAVPADAKEDWKAAVEECKRMLERDGIDWRGAE